MKHYVLVQEPRREGVYVQCRDIDQCLRVVDGELGMTLPVTRVTMFRKAPRQRVELLAMWKVEREGVRRYSVNKRVPRMTRSQSEKRVAELRRRGCNVEMHELDNGDVVVLKRCP